MQRSRKGVWGRERNLEPLATSVSLSTERRGAIHLLLLTPETAVIPKPSLAFLNEGPYTFYLFMHHPFAIPPHPLVQPPGTTSIQRKEQRHFSWASLFNVKVCMRGGGMLEKENDSMTSLVFLQII